MKNWMFNCKKVSRIISESMDRSLPPHRCMGIRLHLMMCRFCRRYEKQLSMLREVMRRYGTDTREPDSKAALSSEARWRMQEMISRETSRP